jgi:hypothetical protein
MNTTTELISLDQLETSIAAINKFRDGIDAIAEAHPKDLVVDVTTPAGMRSAIAARAAWREPRIAVEKARKEAKAPVLKLGKDIDAFASALEIELREGEANYDQQIKKEETRKADEKAAAEQAERERVAAVNQRFQDLRTLALTSADTRLDKTELELLLLGAEGFEVATLPEDMKAAGVYEQRLAITTIKAAIDRRVLQDEEAVKIAAEREELARLREQAAAVDAERQRQEQAQRDAEQAEADRIAAEQAEKARQEREEAIRQEAAAQAARDAEQAQARAVAEAEERVRKEAREEQERQERRAAEIKADNERRAANVASRRRIDKAAIAAFIANGISEQAAKDVIVLIAAGEIPAITITY